MGIEIGSGHEGGVGLIAGEDEAMSFDGWWGWREREKKSDGLEKGKQILAFFSFLFFGDAKWNMLGGKQIFGKFWVGKKKKTDLFWGKNKNKNKRRQF